MRVMTIVRPPASAIPDDIYDHVYFVHDDDEDDDDYLVVGDDDLVVDDDDDDNSTSCLSNSWMGASRTRLLGSSTPLQSLS